MAQIGRKIYYDKLNGNVILDTGERSGSVVETTFDQDIATFTVLSERNRGTFDVIELPFGGYAQDFAESNGYRVNVTNGTLEFSYPDPNAPEAPRVFVKPLTEQITEVQLAIAELAEAVAGGTA